MAKNKKQEVLKKFAMRQGERAARKVDSGTVVPPVGGVGGKVSSSEALLAQLGGNVFKDPKTGHYTSSPWTPTEDMGFSGNLKLDTELTDIMKKTFVQGLKKRKILPNS